MDICLHIKMEDDEDDMHALEISMIDPDYENAEEDIECIICLDIIEDHASIYKNTICICEYTAHDACLRKWFKENKSCVMCRKELSPKAVNHYQGRINFRQRTNSRQNRRESNNCISACIVIIVTIVIISFVSTITRHTIH